MQAASKKNLLHKIQRTLRLDELSPAVRRTLVVVVGGTVLLVGVAMVALPGPAFIVIPAGLMILATEFVWARRLLVKARSLLKKGREKATAK